MILDNVACTLATGCHRTYVENVKISPLYLAGLAVSAIDGLNAVGIRPPYVATDDFVTGGVLDSRGRHWIVKCPLNSTAATSLEAEAAIAPLLLEELRRGELPFDIIRPAGFAPTTNGGRAIVYPEPFGTPGDFETINLAEAREVGRALASIHMLPGETVDHAGLPHYSVEEFRTRELAELHDADQASNIPSALRQRWEEALENTDLWDFDPVVVHGDVDSENFLWSGSEISAVLGFGSAKVADPAVDIAPLLSLPDQIFNAIIESYENTRGFDVDDNTQTRAILLSELSVAKWMLYGIRTQNEDIQREARSMLTDLATDVASDPDLEPGPSWNVDPQEK